MSVEMTNVREERDRQWKLLQEVLKQARLDRDLNTCVCTKCQLTDEAERLTEKMHRLKEKVADTIVC